MRIFYVSILAIGAFWAGVVATLWDVADGRVYEPPSVWAFVWCGALIVIGGFGLSPFRQRGDQTGR